MGGAHGGSGGSAGSGGSGGARDAGSDGSVVDCVALRNDVDAKLAAAQVCDPTLGATAQCQDTVEGLCCKEPVRSQSSPETAAYLDALAKYQNAHCLAACTQTLCPVGSSSCMTNVDSTGRCSFGLLPTGP
jgi:hypothetical protein